MDGGHGEAARVRVLGLLWAAGAAREAAIGHPFLVGLPCVAVGMLLLLRGARAVQWGACAVGTAALLLLFWNGAPPTLPHGTKVGLAVGFGLLGGVLGFLLPSIWLALDWGLALGLPLALVGLLFGSLPAAAGLGAVGFLLGCPIGWHMTPVFWRAVCVCAGALLLWFGWTTVAGFPEEPWIQAALAGASVLFAAGSLRFQPRPGAEGTARDEESRAVVRLAKRALESSER